MNVSSVGMGGMSGSIDLSTAIAARMARLAIDVAKARGDMAELLIKEVEDAIGLPDAKATFQGDPGSQIDVQA